MLPYLNAGFGELLSPADLTLIQGLGYRGVRQNVPTPDSAFALVPNILDSGLNGIFIVPVENADTCREAAYNVAVMAEKAERGADVAIEVGNEEDLRGKALASDPEGFGRLVRSVADMVWSRSQDIQVISGGISSLSKTAIAWVSKAVPQFAPYYGIGVGYHQYRSTDPKVPLDGYSSREAEFRALKDVAGQHRVWMTETGWHTLPRTSGCWPFKKTVRYSDTQVAGFLESEFGWNQTVGSPVFVVYQLSDGFDPNDDQDHFGIRRVDGTLKPASRIFAV